MAPLASCLSHLRLYDDGLIEAAPIKLEDAQQLTRALPGLQELRLASGDDVAGEALVHLVTQLSQLTTLALLIPCQPAADAVTAAVAAQVQAQAGLREGTLTIGLTEGSYAADVVRDGAARLLNSGLVGSPQRVFLFVNKVM